MPVIDKYIRVPLATIRIDRDTRQRREIDTKGLVDSIRLHGVIQPIIIELLSEPIGEALYRLVAGERRCAASAELGLADVPARFAEDLSPTESQILELEENVKRQDIAWQDMVRSAARIHALYLELDPEWTQAETSEAIAGNEGNLSMWLQVARHMEEDRIAGASTAREAWNILQRRQQRAHGEALQEILDTTVEMLDGRGALAGAEGITPPATRSLVLPSGQPAAPFDPAEAARAALSNNVALTLDLPILHQSFLDWAPTYSGPKFNLIHCDFPYGINVFDGGQAGPDRHGSYADGEDVYWTLIESLCTNFDRIASVSCHLLFWYSMNHHERTLAMFRKLLPGLQFLPHPLIWVKSDNAGIVADTRRRPRHVYETCLMASRGGRNIVRVVADAYSAPTDKRFHVSTKPEPMLRHFLSMLVDENTTLLDPTCGSGSALRAGEDLGAKQVLGMDLDEENVRAAREAMKVSRLLRKANRAVV